MMAFPQERGQPSRVDCECPSFVGGQKMSTVGSRKGLALAIGLLLTVPVPVSATQSTPLRGTTALDAQAAAAKRPSGALRVKVKGLPKDAKAKVKVVGRGSRKSISGTKTLKRLKPGKYALKVRRVTYGDAVFTGRAKPKKVKVRSGKRARVKVLYKRQASPTPRPTPTPTPTPTAALRFNFSNAVGVALPDTGSASGANSAASAQVQSSAAGGQLLAVLPDGSTRDAVAEGSLGEVSAAVIGPDGRVYLVIQYGTTCRLLRVNPADGVPECLDADSMINTSQGYTQVNPPLQFDGHGAVYYLGYQSGGSGMQLIRNVDGQRTNLINDNIQIDNWLVYEDSSVFVGGRTTSTMATWFRRITPSGAIKNLTTGLTTPSIATYPDGNVYFGQWGTEGGIRRILTSTMTVDPTWWLSGTLNGLDPPRVFDAEALCSVRPPGMEGFCGNYGTYVRGFYQSGNAVFAIPTGVGGGSLLMRYYPSVEKTNTTTRATIGAAIPGGVALAGQNGAGANVITLYNPQSDSEALLVGEERDIEAYHLNYVAATNSLMFDGLRFSDGKYVIGQVDLLTGEVEIVPSTKMASFQTFG